MSHAAHGEAVPPELQEFFDAARDEPTPGEIARMRGNLAAAIRAEEKKTARKRTAAVGAGALLAAAALAGGTAGVAIAVRDALDGAGGNAGAPHVKLPAEPAGAPDALCGAAPRVRGGS